MTWTGQALLCKTGPKLFSKLFHKLEAAFYG